MTITAAPGGRVRAKEAAALAWLLAVGALAPAAVALSAGLASIPRNDDWSYRAIARHLFETGTLQSDGAAQSFALGQIFAALPVLRALGGSEASFFVVGVGFAVIAVVAGWMLCRQHLDRRDSTLIVTTLLIVPGYAAYSSSFMTDVPALAMTLVCLAAGAASLRRDVDLGLGAVAVIAGVIAFSIRQFAIAAPIAFAIAVLVAQPRSRRAWLLAGCAALLLGAVIAGQRSIGGQIGATPIIPGGFVRAALLIGSTGLFLLPISVLAAARKRPSTRAALLGVIVALLLLVAGSSRGQLTLTLDNLMSPAGVPSPAYTVGSRPLLLGVQGWILIQLLAFGGTALLVACLVDRTPRSLKGIRTSTTRASLLTHLAFFASLTAAGLLAYSLLFEVFDRYLWPLLIPTAVLLVHPSGLRSRGRIDALPMAAVSLLAVFSVAYALNSFAFDAARWRAGQFLVAGGLAADSVDAGYEWAGTYAPAPALVSDRQTRPQDSLTWYGNIWPNFVRCGIVASEALTIEGFQLAGTVDYQQFLVAGPAVPLSLLVAPESACKPVTSVPQRTRW